MSESNDFEINWSTETTKLILRMNTAKDGLIKSSSEMNQECVRLF